MTAPPLPVIEQPRPRPEWLASLREDILEPGLRIVDPHHHFSNHWGGYLGPDLADDVAGGHAVAATVYLQCGFGFREGGPAAFAPVGETETALRIAREAAALAPATRLCAGIVGYADLTLPVHELDAVLAAHVEAGQGRFRGVRRSAGRHASFNYGVLEPPPWNVYEDTRLRRGVARLADFGLTFDALGFHTQLDEVTALAQAVPGTGIVLNHLGAPLGVGPYRGRRDAAFSEWRAAMGRLAACPNVHVKLGGMGMATFGTDFAQRERPVGSDELAAAWRPWVEACIELFGVRRCMFESNFPVEKSHCSYAVLWNAFKRITAGASPADRQALFCGNATRFYRLDLD